MKSGGKVSGDVNPSTDFTKIGSPELLEAAFAALAERVSRRQRTLLSIQDLLEDPDIQAVLEADGLAARRTDAESAIWECLRLLEQRSVEAGVPAVTVKGREGDTLISIKRPDAFTDEAKWASALVREARTAMKPAIEE